MNAFDLSVVVAVAPGRPEWDSTLASLAVACSRFRTEVLVVGGPEHRAADDVVNGLTLRAVAGADDDLAPVRWGRGAALATAPLVGFLTTECVVAPTWAEALLAHLADPKVVGAAGALDLPPGASATNTAVHLLRFASFLPRPVAGPGTVQNIPGDGAIYRRSRIAEHPDLLAEGFWEIEFHRRWLAAGDRLVLDPGPLVTSLAQTTLIEGMKLRFRHGVRYGATMVLRHHHTPMRHLLLAPLVPPLLTWRIATRAMRLPGGIRLVWRSLLPLLALATAWSVGEALGALRAGSRGAP